MTGHVFHEKNVLITGGLGFVGSNLARRLVDLGAHVILVDSLIPRILSTNPAANYRAHRDEIDQAVHRVLDRALYILGDEVARFEEEFSHCRSLASAFAG